MVTTKRMTPPDLGEVNRERPIRCRQLLQLAGDMSGSMGEAYGPSKVIKFEDVGRHLEDPQDGFVARLQASALHRMWEVGLTTFDTRAQSRAPKPVDQLRPGDLALDMTAHGGRTAIGTGLEEAGRRAEQWQHEADPDGYAREVVIMLYTDGLENEGSDPERVAAELKARRYTLVMVAYGDMGDEGEALLRKLASTRPDGSPYFGRVDSGAALRDFLEGSAYIASAAS